MGLRLWLKQERLSETCHNAIEKEKYTLLFFIEYYRRKKDKDSYDRNRSYSAHSELFENYRTTNYYKEYFYDTYKAVRIFQVNSNAHIVEFISVIEKKEPENETLSIHFLDYFTLVEYLRRLNIKVIGDGTYILPSGETVTDKKLIELKRTEEECLRLPTDYEGYYNRYKNYL